MITEEFLYYIWQFRKWDKDVPFLSTHGEKIEVISPGQRNGDAGPDFTNAKVKINNVLWVGNVEIHVKSQDWLVHNHQQNKAYHNIILHVVYLQNHTHTLGNFSTIELKDKISLDLISKYQKLNNPNHFIPCEALVAEIDTTHIAAFEERLFVQRLETKSKQLSRRITNLKGDWEALLFEEMGYTFGLKINAEPFRNLARSFPFTVLQKNKTNAAALLFGQAGFLENPQDKYSKNLYNAYAFLAHKYQLTSLAPHLFKYFRLRPANFPGVRIAQWTAVYTKSTSLFQDLIELDKIDDFHTFFRGIKTDDYWDSHYKLNQKSSRIYPKEISKNWVNLFLINTWIPILYTYGIFIGNHYFERITHLMTQIPPEENKTIQNFKRLGIKVEHALSSQAFLELKKNFCNQKKCLHCNLGNQILKNVR